MLEEAGDVALWCLVVHGLLVLSFFICSLGVMPRPQEVHDFMRSYGMPFEMMVRTNRIACAFRLVSSLLRLARVMSFSASLWASFALA